MKCFKLGPGSLPNLSLGADSHHRITIFPMIIIGSAMDKTKLGQAPCQYSYTVLLV